MSDDGLLWRIGVPAALMHDRRELLRSYTRRRQELLDLAVYERDVALEERAEVRRLNNRRAELGYAAVKLPGLPRRELPPVKTPLPAILTSGRRASSGGSVPVHAYTRLARAIAWSIAGLGTAVVEGLLVEVDRRICVADPPTYAQYAEEFRPGAFEVAPGLLPVVFERDELPVVGYVVGLEERSAGLYARYQLTAAEEAKLVQLIVAGMLTGLGAVFAPVKTKVHGTAVVHERVRLHKVSICRKPAFKQARVAVTQAA